MARPPQPLQGTDDWPGDGVAHGSDQPNFPVHGARLGPYCFEVASRRRAGCWEINRVIASRTTSTLNFAGTPDEVLALGRAGVIEVFISPPILEEIEGVLLRKFRC